MSFLIERRVDPKFNPLNTWATLVRHNVKKLSTCALETPI